MVASLLIAGSLVITALSIWNSTGFQFFRHFGKLPDGGAIDDAPVSETKVGSGHSAEVIHQKELSFVLFYAGTFLRTTGAGQPFPGKSGSWNLDGTVTLANDRVVPFHLASINPNRLELNEKTYDLREGRVFILRDNGPVKQQKIDVSLATALDPDGLAKQIAGAEGRDPSIPRNETKAGNAAVHSVSPNAPVSVTKVGHGASTAVIHDMKTKELSGVLFYAGTFRHPLDARAHFPGASDSWSLGAMVTLQNDREIPYRLASSDPLHVIVDKESFDLREGRVLILHDDGPVEQRKIEVSLSTALDPDALAKQIGGESGG